MFALALVPGAALAIGMYFMPFTPRWLVQKGREDEAREVLETCRFEDDDIQGEIDEIKQVSQEEHRRLDAERLHRLHERVLHDRRDPAAR